MDDAMLTLKGCTSFERLSQEFDVRVSELTGEIILTPTKVPTRFQHLQPGAIVFEMDCDGHKRGLVVVIAAPKMVNGIWKCCVQGFKNGIVYNEIADKLGSQQYCHINDLAYVQVNYERNKRKGFYNETDYN